MYFPNYGLRTPDEECDPDGGLDKHTFVVSITFGSEEFSDA